MRKTEIMKKALSILLCICMLISYVPVSAHAAEISTLYLKPNSNWLDAGARFAVCLATDGWSASAWVSGTDSNSDGVYEFQIPNDGNAYSIVVFCRMDPSTTENNWDNRWDQTNDLTIPSGKDCYTVADGAWSNGDGTWSTYGSSGGGDEGTIPETIYFKNTAGWSKVNAYFFDKSTVGTSWPGAAMTAVEGDVYSIKVPEGAVNVIFNDGSDQTADLTIPTDGKNLCTYSTGAWSTYGSSGGDTSAKITGVTVSGATQNDEGVYVITPDSGVVSFTFTGTNFTNLTDNDGFKMPYNGAWQSFKACSVDTEKILQPGEMSPPRFRA